MICRELKHGQIQPVGELGMQRVEFSSVDERRGEAAALGRFRAAAAVVAAVRRHVSQALLQGLDMLIELENLQVRSGLSRKRLPLLNLLLEMRAQLLLVDPHGGTDIGGRHCDTRRVGRLAVQHVPTGDDVTGRVYDEARPEAPVRLDEDGAVASRFNRIVRGSRFCTLGREALQLLWYSLRR